jgi:ribosome-associated protein
MAGPLMEPGGVTIPPKELTWRFSRSSGPGGQGVNTANSRVELVFDLAASGALSAGQKDRATRRVGAGLHDGVLGVAASEHRSQLRNRQEAERRLAQLLAQAIAPPPRPRRPTRATRASVERRLAAKKRRSQLKRARRGEE